MPAEPKASRTSAQPRRRVIVRTVLIALVALGVAGGVIRWGLARAEAPKPNVILISIDTCRADYIGCYNPGRPITPNVDALSAQATLFVNAAAPTPMTLPSHTSMLTGRIPLVHGVYDNGQIVPQANQTLAELLKANGYATAGFVSSAVLARQYGLDQGFDIYHEGAEIRRGLQKERTADATTMQAINWLVQRDLDKPFFLFVHFYDAHWPYEPPEPFASGDADPYAGEIAFVDAAIGRLMDALKAAGVYDSSVVIVTADHGEMLGEHGEDEHGYYIYDSAIKVPLILKHPKQQTGRRVDAIVGLVDIVPSVCSIADVAAPTDLDGRDVSDRAGDWAAGPSRSLYIQSAYPQVIFDANPLLGLVDNRWKFIHTKRSELYDLSADPAEQTNLLQAKPGQARVMQDALDAVVAGAATRKLTATASADAQTRQMLESLGYLGSGQGQANLEIDATKADPKDLIDVYADFYEVWLLRDAGRLDEAAAKCQDLARAHPDIYIVQWVLASLLLETDRYAEGLQPCEAMDALGPDDPRTHRMKGVLYGRLARHAEARDALRRAVELDPTVGASHRGIGDACAALGDYEEAALAYQTALAIGPQDPKSLRSLALLYAEPLNSPETALPLAKRLLDLRPGDPRGLETYGWVLARQGDLPQALKYLQEAHQQRPTAETCYRFGWALEKSVRMAEALEQYRAAADLLADRQDDPLAATVAEAITRVEKP